MCDGVPDQVRTLSGSPPQMKARRSLAPGAMDGPSFILRDEIFEDIYHGLSFQKGAIQSLKIFLEFIRLSKRLEVV